MVNSVQPFYENTVIQSSDYVSLHHAPRLFRSRDPCLHIYICIWVVSRPTRGLSCRQICFASRPFCLTEHPEERANNRVGSRNKFVDRRVYELVEKLLNITTPYGSSTLPTRVPNGQPLHIYIYVVIVRWTRVLAKCSTSRER